MKGTATYYRIVGELNDYLPTERLTNEFMKTYLKIRRLAKKHHRLAEYQCNGEGYVRGKFWKLDNPKAYIDDETNVFDVESEKVEKKISKLAKEIGLTVDFQGDPRGNTVKLYDLNGWIPIVK